VTDIRDAAEADLPLLEQLYGQFEQEVPEPQHTGHDPEQEVREVRELVRGDGIALLAGEDGFALAYMKSAVRGFLSDLYVRPSARGRGLAHALALEAVAQLRARGATTIELDVLASNADARAIYARWGFSDVELRMVADAKALEGRLSGEPAGASYGAVYLQTDDEKPIRRALGRFVPRLPDAQITGLQRGWQELTHPRLDEDPPLLQRLAKELSAATGAVVATLGVEQGAVVRYSLYEAGRAVDEYLSVPEFYGPLPPGDTIALAANPTVVARLTGADPNRVRAICRTAASPGELPPADELYRQVADVLGIASPS
jgi:ribosomal protein S18 acetylase RimI-like enzyme